MTDASAGHEFTGYFLHEDNGFNSSPNDSDPKVFGAEQRLEQAEGSNNATEVMMPASKTPVDVIEQAFNGAWSVSFTYTNPWWLNFIAGAPSTTDNGNGSYTHSWDTSTDPQSQQIVIGRKDNGKERVLTGCVCANATARATVDGGTEVTLSGAYAEEDVRNPASLETQPSLQHDPMTFHHVDLLFDGSSVALAQEASLDFAPNVSLVRELGNRIAVDYVGQQLVPQISFGKLIDAGETTYLEDLYGGSTSVQTNIDSTDSMTLSFNNDVSAGNGINTIDFPLTGTFPDSVAENGLGNARETPSQQLNRMMTGIDFDATNEVSSAR